jgi:ribose 5-phosphate isomerase B
MARRTLIRESDVLAAARAGGETLVVPPGAVVTPLARDTARERGIRLAAPDPGSTKPDGPAPQVVAVGSDHGGYALKTELIPYLRELGWAVIDVGTSSTASCDYPDFAYAVARHVADGSAAFGVMIDGAGMGSAMVCNKVSGVRAAAAYNEFTAWNSRAHNDANVLALGSRSLGIEVCRSLVRIFLATGFEGGRHAARVAKIDDVDTAQGR